MRLPACLLVVVLVLLLVSLLEVEVAEAAATVSIAMPGCKDTCGKVSIPFPFGVGANCSLDPWFEIDCKSHGNTTNGSPKPLLSKLNIEVMSIGLMYPDYTYSLTVSTPPMNSCTTHTQRQSSIDLRGSPYQFSSDAVLVMEGCPGGASVVNQSGYILGGCEKTICLMNSSTSTGTKTCYGSDCCKAQLAFGYSSQFYQIEFDSPSQSCLMASVLSNEYVDYYVQKVSTSHPSPTAAIQLSWELLDWRNFTRKHSSHSTCIAGKSCTCDLGYEGNPLFPGGCQVPEVCKGCPGSCHSASYFYYCEKKKKTLFTLASILGSSISFGIMLLVFGSYGLYCVIKRRREMRRRSKFFKLNGGLLLHQHLLSNEGVVERTKVFTASELDKATDNFSEFRILGQGGQGTVYKGILIDGKIVAVKKSKLLDKSQLEQFINEVVVLSQINHRNVVQLLGCCLETEIPLLVYEFISNGTLSQHIHDPDEEFFMSWEMRLKIAADSAGAIAYLHSSSSTPIYHRDIKSSNILLDEKHRAKVADFGCSKTVAIDQTHSTTLVQGTWGYLDPEYFHSGQFTEKSDVYSFGVVLLELLTSRKPIYRDEAMEPKSLVAEFQNTYFFDMLDQRVVKEAKEEHLIAVVELTKRCISWSRNQRPTMKEVAMTLEKMIKSQAQVATSNDQGFPDDFGEDLMSQISDEGFMSNPLPAAAGAGSPLYTDVRLPDTI